MAKRKQIKYHMKFKNYYDLWGLVGNQLTDADLLTLERFLVGGIAELNIIAFSIRIRL